jgi:ribosomal protein S27AE
MMPTITPPTNLTDYGMTCVQCGDGVIAPEFVEYFSEQRLILNFWSCEKCGYQFESESFVSPDPESEDDNPALEEAWSALF